MKKYAMIMIILSLIYMGETLSANTRFEELDKPPEGAHQGQILLGLFVYIGGSFGECINEEDKFLRFSTHTFYENNTTKVIRVDHLSYAFGVLFEYMPIDYLGLKVKVRKSTILQRTAFGKELENWSRLTYSDFSFYFGPSVHFTVRKQWDFSFTPVVGYAIAEYMAAPVAERLLNEYEYNIIGQRKKPANNLSIGAEFNLTIYFSGGFFMSLGCDWNMNIIKFRDKYSLFNLSNYAAYSLGSTNIHSIGFIISAGYAFLN